MHHLHEEKSASSLGSEIRGIYKQSTTLQKAEYMAMRGGVEVGVGGGADSPDRQRVELIFGH